MNNYDNRRKYPNKSHNKGQTPGRGKPNELELFKKIAEARQMAKGNRLALNGDNDPYTNSVTDIRRGKINEHRHYPLGIGVGARGGPHELPIRDGKGVGAIGGPDELPQNQATQNQGGFATAPNISSALPQNQATQNQATQNHINLIKTTATADQGDQKKSWVNKIMREKEPNAQVR